MIWKTLAGRIIHQGSHGIAVHQNMAYRWLTFDSDAVQTLINRRHPEKYGLQYIQPLTLAARAKPATSCLLGLGGAGVAHAISPWFGDCPLDAVENNPEIIDIAAQYFMTNQIKNLNIIHQDAALFVEQAEPRYYHLMVDLFTAHSFPEQCNNADFFKQCRRVLMPNGILAVNLANLREQWSVYTHIRSHFQHCTISIPVKGAANMIVLACKAQSIKPMLDLLEQSRCLKYLNWDSSWGCVAGI